MSETEDKINYDDFRGTETDLGFFIDFVDRCNMDRTISKIEMSIEDWDGQCGIFLTDKSTQSGNSGFNFQFYKDGSFRCLGDDEYDSYQVKQKIVNYAIATTSLFSLIKKWWKLSTACKNSVLYGTKSDLF